MIANLEARAEARDYADWVASLDPLRRIEIIQATLARHARMLTPAKRPAHRPTSNQTLQVIEWLRANPGSTTVEICAATGCAEQAFYKIRNKHKAEIVRAGRTPNEGRKPGVVLWSIAEGR